MSVQPKSLARIGAAAGLAAALAACAHKPPPPPADVGPPPPPASGPPPSAYGAPVQSGPTAPIPGSVRDFVINAGDRVYFEFNADSLGAEGRQVLDAQAAWLSRYPQVTVRIEGNTDPRGTAEYNLALGARRAEFVKTYLVGRGIAPQRITTISYGKERPIAEGDGEDAWAKDRNAHTTLTGGAVGGGTNGDFNGAAPGDVPGGAPGAGGDQ